MKQRTIELIRYTAMKYDLYNIQTCERTKEWERLCNTYSEKACFKKLIELTQKGYVDYGTSARSAWIEDKGREVLKEAVQ